MNDMDLWIHPEREDYKNNIISYEWLYNHILENEMDSIEFFYINHLYLQITPPEHKKTLAIDGLVYPKFDSIEDAEEALKIVKKLIQL